MSKNKTICFSMLRIISLFMILVLSTELALWSNNTDSDESRGCLVNDIAIDPNDSQVIYITTVDGMFKSTDGGKNWGRPSPYLGRKYVKTVVIDPSDSAVLYAYGDGLLKSSDHGKNWNTLIEYWSAPFRSVVNFIVDPNNSLTLFVGCRDGIFKSVDGGIHWKETYNGDGQFAATVALMMDYKRPLFLYAGIDDGFYKSTDGGNNWVASNQELKGDIYDLAVDLNRPGVVYAVSTRTLYKSMDSGTTWTELKISSVNKKNEFPEGASDVWKIAIAKDSSVIYAGTSNGIYRSMDGGASWYGNKNYYNHHTSNVIAIDPRNSKVVYDGTEHGIYKSTNGGKTWRAINKGIPHIVIGH